MEYLSSYLPIDRRQAIATGSPLPNRSTGAVLFADISGFTALTAALTDELGPRLGAEEITRQLNRVYGELIAQVDQYRGSVIEFSGDAITCWFDGDNGLRAAASALAMQVAMKKFAAVQTRAGAVVELAIKVCVVTGPVRRFLAGDPAIRSIEVLAGQTLNHIDAANLLMHKGEVLLSANIVEDVGSRVSVAEWRSAAQTGERFAVITQLNEPVAEQPWPTDYVLADDVARKWILLPVYERLHDGQERFLAELRPVVAVFLKFDGIDYDGDDAAGQKIDAYICWVQHVIERYEGALLQFNMGDKGSYLYVAFGAPIAHEDDSDRGVAAALDLLSPPASLSFIRNIQIGVSRGQMRTGAYGGPTRRTYGVLGNEVNVAARLMQKAPAGQILVTERIAVTTTASFEFQEIGRGSLKGLSQPLSFFSVRGRRSQHSARAAQPPIVGRTAERRQLSERLQRLKNNQIGGSLIIEGEAGLGKSRLVTEVIDEAQRLAVQTFYGTGDAIEHATAYYAWRSIFNQVLGLEGMVDTSARRAHVLEYLRSDQRLLQWAPLLSEMLQLDLPPNEVTLQMSSLVQADNLQELLVALLTLALQSNYPEAPVLLILEDAHWLDSSSWILLLKVAERIQSVLILIATRPLSTPIPPEYALLLARPDCLHLTLEALPVEEVGTLICQRLGVTSMPPAVAQFIGEKAEGHPFFSEELALALRDAGLIQISDGVCRTAPGVDDLYALDIPTTIQGVITSRIDRLPPPQQLTLKVASIIGRIFTYHILQDVHPIGSDRPHLHDYLDGLTHLDITRLNAPEPELAYIFKHIITQEVAYNLMLFTQRQQLHRVVAEWYERQYSADLSPYYSLLAYHWQRAAEDPQAPPFVRFRAIDYLDQAGDQALRNSAYKEAIDFFEKAMALEPHSAVSESTATSIGQRLPKDIHRRARRYLKLGEALRNWGRASDSRKYLEQAAALYGYPIPTSNREAMVKLLGQIARQILHRLRPARYIGRAAEAEKTILAEVGHVYQLIAEIFFFTNETLLSLYTAALSLNLWESIGTSPRLAETYSIMGLLVGTAGQRRWATAYQQRAIEVARQTNLPIAMAYALRPTSLYCVEMGEWAKAEECLKVCVKIEDDLGDKRNWGDLLSMLAGVHAFRGEIPRAIEMLAEIAGPRSGSLLHRTLSALWQGGFLLRLGRFDEAISLLNTALDLTRDSTDALTMVYSKINSWTYLAVAYLHQEKYSPARQAADVAWQMIVEAKPGAFHLASAFEYIVEAYLKLITTTAVQSDAERQQMIKAAEKLTRDLLRTGSPTIKMRGWHCQGLCYAQRGQLKPAQQAWHKYLATAERLEMPYESGLAHYEIGRHLSADDPARQAHLVRAHALFEQIGAIYERAQTEDAINQAQPMTAAVINV